MATDASDRDLTENGVTFRAKVMALKTVTTVKACRHKDLSTQLADSQVSQLALRRINLNRYFKIPDVPQVTLRLLGHYFCELYYFYPLI